MRFRERIIPNGRNNNFGDSSEVVLDRRKVIDSMLHIQMDYDVVIIIKHHIDNIIVLLSHEISKAIGILF